MELNSFRPLHPPRDQHLIYVKEMDGITPFGWTTGIEFVKSETMK